MIDSQINEGRLAISFDDGGINLKSNHYIRNSFNNNNSSDNNYNNNSNNNTIS